MTHVGRAVATVDLRAVRTNVRTMRRLVDPADVCAVVKADGYGHGAIAVARAAWEGGATRLAVATVPEAAALRADGIEAPILLLSEPAADEVVDAVALDLDLTVYSEGTVRAVAAAAAAPVALHVKVDTGMHRVGTDPETAKDLVAGIEADPLVHLVGACTHLAVADEPDNPFTDEQLDRFDTFLHGLRATGVTPPIVHAANSAGAIAHPRARHDMVRVGIALYGIAPSPAVAGAVDLLPALSLRSQVALVRRVPAGDGVSYGLAHRFERESTVATVPIGYADGVRRSLSAVGGEVLVGGHRRRIVGVVTMDQLMVDCGDDDVAVGDEVVLIGPQGDEAVTAEEWAARLGTIGYEITCGIGPRVVRDHVDG